MNNNYKYLINEKAQLFIKIDNKSTKLNYENRLSNLQNIGVNSIQIFTNSINSINTINTINILSNLKIKNIVLNIDNINEDMINMLSDKINYISVWLTQKSLKEKISIFTKLKQLHPNIGINLQLFEDENWISLVKLIIDLYNPSYIILDPKYMLNNSPNINKYFDNFNKFQQIIKAFNIPIYMAIGIYNKDFIIDHPCNIYLCSGKHCHTGKGNKVRRLCIDTDGTILPESFNFNTSYSLGNIQEEKLLDIINTSSIKGFDLKFLSLCKTLYENVVLPSPSSVIPWINLLTFWSNCKDILIQGEIRNV